jgi:glycerophosphoryl diester phosphodiesterase
MKLAWQQKADAIETDLWLSKDGKIIVFHDADTKRIGKVNRKISDYTLAEAQQVDIASWKGAQYVAERIPSLESLLATIPEGSATSWRSNADRKSCLSSCVCSRHPAVQLRSWR